jgi:hypothetical protein
MAIVTHEVLPQVQLASLAITQNASLLFAAICISTAEILSITIISAMGWQAQPGQVFTA